MKDVDLYEWIDKLQEEELRGVIKYLVLLNAEAVQNAMSYTLQQQQRGKEEEEEGNPPPLHRTRTNTEDIVDDALHRPSTANAVKPQRPTGHVNFTPNPQLLSANMANNITLIVLCSMKPATKQDAIDQDEAMALCKQIGVLPYIVLAESKPEKLKQLLSISHADNVFPQFFLSEPTNGHVEFLGTYQTIKDWNQQGILKSSQDLAKLSTAPPPQPRTLNFDDQPDLGSAPQQAQDLNQHLLHFNQLSLESDPRHLPCDPPKTLRPTATEAPQPFIEEQDIEEEEENLRLTRQSLEPPEEKDVLLQTQSHNRREEPPAKSPPKPSQKMRRTREQQKRPLDEDDVAPPPTPNQRVQVVHYEEPPAMSPPMTSQKAQRRVHQQEKQGQLTSTPNAQVVKKYSLQQIDKPEPSPGGANVLRYEDMSLEPPTVHKTSQMDAYVASPHSDKNNETTAPKSPETPDTPGWMEKLQGQPVSPATTTKLQEEEEPQEQTQESPADDQVLSLLDGVGACYLVYDDTETGQLNIYYSESPIDQSVGVWTAPDILDFKEAQGLSESEFIGNCASDCVTNPANYFKGWSQFVKAAKSMDGTVITLVKHGMPVDFYVYSNNQGNPYCEKVPGIQFDIANFDAVACLPRNVPFDYVNLRGRKWSKQAKKLGSVATFNSLVHNAGFSGSSDSPPRSTVSPQPITAPPSTLSEPSSLGNLQANPTDEERVHVPASPEIVPGTPIVPPKPLPLAYPSALAAPSPEGGACYLVYEPASSGRLVEYYSRTPVEEAIGRWIPGPGKKIAGFKFKQNHGRSVLIGNCSAGVLGRKNYCSGWNQFVRSAKVYAGDVMLWDPADGVKGLAVDVWLYNMDTRPGHQSQKLEIGLSTKVESILAVCTIPKKTPFYDGISVDLLKWLADGSNYGASSKFES